MALISDSYLKLNQDLHHSSPAFGMSGHRWNIPIRRLISHNSITDVLDYGAGKETLKAQLADLSAVTVRGYDPAIPALSALPSPAQFVSCTDVLEHIEPENLDDVLDHLATLTLNHVFLVIATGPAGKVLADGRNAHLIQQPVAWWLPKLLARWDMVALNHFTGEIIFVGTRKSQDQTYKQFHADLAAYLGAVAAQERIMSWTVDSVAGHLVTKPFSMAQRLGARLLSLLSLGKRKGVALMDKSKMGQHPLTILHTRV